MEIKLVEKKDDKLKFEVYGADHAIMNLLRDKVEHEKGVDFATYSTPHPLLDGYVMTVRGKKPEKVVEKALSDLKKENKSLASSLKKR